VVHSDQFCESIKLRRHHSGYIHYNKNNVLNDRRHALACRFSRLANGSNKVSVADLQSLPELSGNVFIPCIFQMYADRQGYLNLKDFTSAVEKLGQLYTGEDRAECERQALDKGSVLNDMSCSYT